MAIKRQLHVFLHCIELSKTCEIHRKLVKLLHCLVLFSHIGIIDRVARTYTVTLLSGLNVEKNSLYCRSVTLYLSFLFSLSYEICVSYATKKLYRKWVNGKRKMQNIKSCYSMRLIWKHSNTAWCIYIDSVLNYICPHVFWLKIYYWCLNANLTYWNWSSLIFCWVCRSIVILLF